NRRYFEHQVKLEVQKAKQTKMAVSLVFIDLDRFKSINDTHGHDAGDEVLIKVVERITENIRDTDILARYGGEEFVMILPHSTMQSAAEKVELILEDMRNKPLFSHNGTDMYVTFSAGVTEWSEHMTVKEWIKK